MTSFSDVSADDFHTHRQMRLDVQIINMWSDHDLVMWFVSYSSFCKNLGPNCSKISPVSISVPRFDRPYYEGVGGY